MTVSEKIIGTPEFVEKEVKAYFDRYHPYGYSTKIVRDVTVDGIRTVYIERDSSSD